MHLFLKVIVFLGAVTSLVSPLSAQQGVVSTGGDIQAPAGSVAFSIGQTASQIIDGETGSVHQGLQQPYTYQVTSVEDLREDIAIRLYPNPAESFVYVHLTPPATGFAQDRFTARLYDLSGKLILEQVLDSDVNTISISRLREAIYLLQVWQGHHFIKSYSFTKVN